MSLGFECFIFKSRSIRELLQLFLYIISSSSGMILLERHYSQ